MKPLLTALALTLATTLAVTPALAQNVDMGSLTPTLTYPDPAPAPVTKNDSGINK